MSSHITNISNLPVTDYVQSGDKFLVFNNNIPYLIDYENIIISIDQINFADKIDEHSEQIVTLSARNDTYVNILTSKIDAPPTALNLSVLATSGSLSGYLTLGSIPVSSEEIRVSLNDIEVNYFSSQINVSDPNACDVTLSLATSSVVLPRGTYRVKCNATLSLREQTGTSDNQTWAYMSLRRVTPPKDNLLISNPTYSVEDVPMQSNLFINGYFYLCNSTEIALYLTTRGKYVIGADEIISPSLLGYSIIQALGYNNIRPIQLMIEQISTSNTLSALI